MLSLYEYPNSVCCQKVNLALGEKGLEWESVTVNLAKNEHYSSEYLKLNPKAVVPTLVHDGVPIIESTLICEYLAESFPGNALIPESPLGRTKMRWWNKAVDEGLHDGVADISFSAMFRDRMKRMPEDKRQMRFDNIGDPKRSDRTVSTFEQGVDSPFVRYAVYAFEAAFKKMDAELADDKDWLVENNYSLADLGLTPYFARLENLGILTVWIEDRSKVTAWWERIKTRPSYEKAVSGPLSAVEIEEMKSSGIIIKDQIKTIRDELQSVQSNA